MCKEKTWTQTGMGNKRQNKPEEREQERKRREKKLSGNIKYEIKKNENSENTALAINKELGRQGEMRYKHTLCSLHHGLMRASNR